MEDHPGKSPALIRKFSFMMFAVFLMAACVIDAIRYLPGQVTVTSSHIAKMDMPIYHVTAEEPYVALTFDVGGNHDGIQKILDVLDSRQVKATFFASGEWIDKYPEEISEICRRGHDLGIYGDNPEIMNQLTYKELQSNLLSVQNKVKSLTGYEMNLLRLPYSGYERTVITNAKKCGYYSVKWDIDSMDWKNYGSDSIVHTVMENGHLQNGSIIRFRTDARYTADALSAVTDTLFAQGYEPVAVSKMLELENTGNTGNEYYE